MNALFAAGDDVVIRVGRAAFSPVDEAAWLSTMSRVDVRVPQLRRDVLEVDGLMVAAVERIHHAGPVDWEAVGAMIRRLHDLDPAGLVLPWCGDFAHWQVDELLADVAPDLDPAARDGIEDCLRRWSGWRERLRGDLVVCHGDLHPGNVIQGADGPALLDWDLRCLGPAAWDHGPLLTWEERWDGEPGTYDAFASGYGRSMRGDPLADCMADLRNVVATLLRVRAGRRDPVAAAEAQRRLRFWRGDPDAPRWTPQ